MKKILTFVSIISLAILLLAGCGGSTANQNKEEAKNTAKKLAVDLLLTRDYGSKTIFEQSVEYKQGATILDILQANLRVETAYGGSFVNAINGLKSNLGGGNGERQDWFYYVNGIACDVGVLDYDPRNAASIWWDYHSWQSGPANSAVIGCFPEPFAHGYQGKLKTTQLMSSPDDVQWGQKLSETMKTNGVSRIAINKIDVKILEKREGPTIVWGEWDDLKKLKYLDEFNQAYDRNAAGIHFTTGGLELLDSNGEAVKKLESAGVIIATGEGLGDDSPLWLVSGTDQAAWQNAMNILIKHPAKIRHLYGAAVVGEELIPLPVQ